MIEKKFTHVYKTNYWDSIESLSGPGSQLKYTVNVLSIFKNIIEANNISSILDLPCGDLNWMSDFIIDNPHLSYLGCDIVDDLIQKNSTKYVSIKCIFLN